jgi:hypothetical protein
LRNVFLREAGFGFQQVLLGGKPAESCKRSFDETTPPINGEIAWDIGFAIFLGRDHGEGAVIVELLAQPIVGKAYVVNQRGDPVPSISGATPTLLFRCPGSSTKRSRSPSASTSATILVVRPSRAPSAGSG